MVIIMGAGLADTMGAGLVVIIMGAGAITTGAGLCDTITGAAADAGVASITLGLGLGAARPTPIIAKFESSISRGHGFNLV
jgi:hypothetical protein